jgi:hypothetical protein
VQVAQQHLRILFQEQGGQAQQTASTERTPLAVLVGGAPRFIFDEALVQLTPDAALQVNALVARATDAISAWEAEPGRAGLRPPAEVVESTIRLAGAVALSAGDDNAVTAEEAAAALRGVCPLYPFC